MLENECDTYVNFQRARSIAFKYRLQILALDGIL